MTETPAHYEFPTLGVRLGKTPNESIRTSTEGLQKGVEVSKQARNEVISVFARFGKPLGDSLEPSSQSFHISVEGGVNSNTYKPNGNIAQTGGMLPDYRTGDLILGNAKGNRDLRQSQLNTGVSILSDLQSQYNRASELYNQRIVDNNNFVDKNIATFQDGWDLVNAGLAEFIFRPGDGTWVIQRTLSESKSTIPDIDQKIANFNNIQSRSNALNNAVTDAWNQVNHIDRERASQLGDLDRIRARLSDAEKSVFEAQKSRYRYMLSSVNFSEKVSESQKVWKTLYNKDYTTGEVTNQYYGAMDSLGMLMTKIQGGSILTEADYKKEISEIGKALTDEQKIIFLGMVGANLNRLTYNWDIITSGDFKNVKPFESMQALAKAFQTGKVVPAGVCSSIHVAVASMAESWGTPAGTLTVSSGGVGHVVAIMNIGGKKVISDYGKIYTADNMENLIDTYAIANKGIAIRNYITDSNGNIIGHVDTPLTKAFRREVLSSTIVNDFLRDGKTPEDGVSIILYRDRKGLRGQYTFENGIYISGKYSEASLLSGVQSRTSQVEAGKKWNDIDLGGGWNGTAFVSGTFSQAKLKFGSQESDKTNSIGQFQAGFRGEKSLTSGSNIYLGGGARIIGQGSKPSTDGYTTIGPLGTGVTAESGLNFVAGTTIQATPETKYSGEIGVDADRGPNVQNIRKTDLNPFGKSYSSTSVRFGAETKIGGGVGTGKVEVKQGPLSQERTIGVGYSTETLGARIEQTNIRQPHIFGPSGDTIIKANIEKNFGKGITGFVGIEDGKVTGKKTQIGAKFTF